MCRQVVFYLVDLLQDKNKEVRDGFGAYAAAFNMMDYQFTIAGCLAIQTCRPAER